MSDRLTRQAGFQLLLAGDQIHVRGKCCRQDQKRAEHVWVLERRLCPARQAQLFRQTANVQIADDTRE